jgi:hypothetical protein
VARELIIDLGERFAPVEDPASARERRGHSHRTLAAVAVVIVALLALTGSAVRATPLAPKIASVVASAGGTFMVVGTTVVVADMRDGRNAMTAYRLTDGAQLWSARLSVLTSNVNLERLGNVVVAGFHGPDVYGDKAEGVDLRTGAAVWTNAGEIVQAYPSAGTLLLHDRDNFSMVEVATGTVRWTHAVHPFCAINVADHLVVLCPETKQLQVIDLGTGVVDASRSNALPEVYSTSNGRYDDTVKLAELEGVVIVGHLDHTGSRLDGYAASDLAPRWSIPFFDSAMLEPCHEILCVSDGRISSGLDPQTGDALPFPGFDPPADAAAYSGPGPADASSKLALIPAGASRGTYPGGISGFEVQTGYSNASAVATYPESIAIGVPGSTRVDSWVATVRVGSRPRGEIAITPVQRLAGIGVQSCALVDPYLLCAVNRHQMDIYDVSKLTRKVTG